MHRWKDKFLHSAIKEVTPGLPTVFTINGTNVSVTVPAAGKGARGVVIADPCFHGAVDGCSYGEQLQTFSRMTALLNAATADPAGTGAGADYWMVLGDNVRSVALFLAREASGGGRCCCAAKARSCRWSLLSRLLLQVATQRGVNACAVCLLVVVARPQIRC